MAYFSQKEKDFLADLMSDDDDSDDTYDDLDDDDS
jgi:hypothetical protein